MTLNDSVNDYLTSTFNIQRFMQALPLMNIYIKPDHHPKVRDYSKSFNEI